MSNIKYNKSKTYLLPLLTEVVEFDRKFFSNILNTYVADDLGMYKNSLLIYHDFTFRNPEFTFYEHKLTNSQYFTDLIDIDNMVLYVFRFPDEYMKEYNNFLEGKYSEFGNDAKELILTFYTHIYQNNLNAVGFLVKLRQILFKDSKLKEQLEKNLKINLPVNAELTDIPDLNKETFILSQHYNKIQNKNNNNLNNFF